MAKTRFYLDIINQQLAKGIIDPKITLLTLFNKYSEDAKAVADKTGIFKLECQHVQFCLRQLQKFKFTSEENKVVKSESKHESDPEAGIKQLIAELEEYTNKYAKTNDVKGIFVDLLTAFFSVYRKYAILFEKNLNLTLINTEDCFIDLTSFHALIEREQKENPKVIIDPLSPQQKIEFTPMSISPDIIEENLSRLKSYDKKPAAKMLDACALHVTPSQWSTAFATLNSQINSEDNRLIYEALAIIMPHLSLQKKEISANILLNEVGHNYNGMINQSLTDALIQYVKFTSNIQRNDIIERLFVRIHSSTYYSEATIGELIQVYIEHDLETCDWTMVAEQIKKCLQYFMDHIFQGNKKRAVTKDILDRYASYFPKEKWSDIVTVLLDLTRITFPEYHIFTIDEKYIKDSWDKVVNVLLENMNDPRELVNNLCFTQLASIIPKIPKTYLPNLFENVFKYFHDPKLHDNVIKIFIKNSEDVPENLRHNIINMYFNTPEETRDARLIPNLIAFVEDLNIKQFYQIFNILIHKDEESSDLLNQCAPHIHKLSEIINVELVWYNIIKFNIKRLRNVDSLDDFINCINAMKKCETYISRQFWPIYLDSLINAGMNWQLDCSDAVKSLISCIPNKIRYEISLNLLNKLSPELESIIHSRMIFVLKELQASLDHGKQIHIVFLMLNAIKKEGKLEKNQLADIKNRLSFVYEFCCDQEVSRQLTPSLKSTDVIGVVKSYM